MRWSEGGRKQVVSETRVRASEWKTDEITQKHTMPRAAIYSWKQSCSQFCLSQHSLNYADETAAACCGTMDVEKAAGREPTRDYSEVEDLRPQREATSSSLKIVGTSY